MFDAKYSCTELALAYTVQRICFKIEYACGQYIFLAILQQKRKAKENNCIESVHCCGISGNTEKNMFIFWLQLRNNLGIRNST